MKAPIIATVVSVIAAVSFTADVAAKSSTPSEFRGYQACLEATADQFQGLVTERDYLLSNAGGQLTYYINATAWEDGQRVAVGISCDTNTRGRTVLNQTVTRGHYASASQPGVQVAGQ